MPRESLAYDSTTTHPALTREAVRLYNLRHPEEKISEEEAGWIIKGSIKEDTPPRWINHFYDPIYERGLSGENVGVIPAPMVRVLTEIGISSEKPRSSVEWATDSSLQQAYRYFGGDQSWETALSKMREGEKEEAFTALGHILHLLEDLGVPDHSRDDAHAAVIGNLTGDTGSPYESYAVMWNEEKTKSLMIPENLFKNGESSRKYAAIGDDDGLLELKENFRTMALFSNKYFFSKDTINDPRYQEPKITRSDGKFGYGIDSKGLEFPLVARETIKDAYGREILVYGLRERGYYYDIFNAYFSRLAPEVIVRGADIIDLFLEKSVMTGADINASKPAPERLVVSLYGTIKKAGDFFKSSLVSLKNVLARMAASARDSLSGLFGTEESVTAVPISVKKSSGVEQSSKNSSIIVKTGDSGSGSTQKTTNTSAKKTAASSTAKNSPSASSSPKTTVSSTIIKNLTTTSTSSPFFSGATSSQVVQSGVSASVSETNQSSAVNSNENLPDSSGSESSWSVLISEARIGGKIESNDEFVELYNTSDSPVPISEGSIQYVSGIFSDSGSVKKRNFSDGLVVPAYGYFLIARGLDSGGGDGYFGEVTPDFTERTFSMSGISSGGTVFIVRNQEVIESLDDPDIVDSVSYGRHDADELDVALLDRAELPPKGSSIERKALVNGECVPVFPGCAGEYEGNSCDIGSDGEKFSVRAEPDPQNTASLSEPRIPSEAEAAVSAAASCEAGGGGSGGENENSEGLNFVAELVTSTYAMNFKWDLLAPATTSVNYELRDVTYNSDAPPIFSSTSTTAFTHELSQAGLTYKFELRVNEKNGGTAVATSSIEIPGVADDIGFYESPAGGGYVFDIRYQSVPFIPPRWSRAYGDPIWQGMVFYLNSEPDPSNRYLDTDGRFWPQNAGNVIPVFYGGKTRGSVVFAVDPRGYGNSGGGLKQDTFMLPEEDGRLVLFLASSTEEANFTDNDYVTVAYYDFSNVGGGTQELIISFVDKTKYYFSKNPPKGNKPSSPEARILFNEISAELKFSWSPSVDSDSEDGLLKYEYSVGVESNPESGGSWIEATSSSMQVTMPVVYGEEYRIKLRAIDEFGNASDATIMEWTWPGDPPFPSQIGHDVCFGPALGRGQSFVSNQSGLVSAVSLWTANDGGNSCCAESYIELRADTDGSPGEIMSTSSVAGIDGFDVPSERSYGFENLFLEKEETYWIVPVSSKHNRTRLYGAINNPYALGAWNGGDQDLYFKILK